MMRMSRIMDIAVYEVASKKFIATTTGFLIQRATGLNILYLSRVASILPVFALTTTKVTQRPGST